MAEFTNKIKQNVTITNEIYVDGVQVKGQQAIIKSDDPNDVTFSSWPIRKDLCKENREVIREIEAQFEEYVYSKQDEMLAEKVSG